MAIDDRNLYIYTIEKDGLKLKKEVKGTAPSWNYNVAVGDFNGNGFPEIYLSRRYMEKAATRVFEFNGKDFTVIADDLPWFIRTVKGQKTVLIGEKFRQIDGLYGGIKNLIWKNGTLEEGGLLDTPKWTGLYGFTLCDATGDGKDDFISLSENDLLVLYEKDANTGWKQSWNSTDYYGGSANFAEYGPTGPDQKSLNIKAEIVCGGAAGDGRREILVSSNKAYSRIFKSISYESGDIRGLLWNEFGLDEAWRTRKLSGYIADYAVVDVDRGPGELFALVVIKQASMFSPGESMIITLFPEGRNKE